MIDWNAIKQAGEAKRGLFRSGRGAYKLEPDAGDVANLAGLSDAEYLAARDAIIDRDVKQLQQYRLRDQTLKKDNAARAWSLLGGMSRSLYQRHKIRNEGLDVDYDKLDPRHLKAYQKTEMYNAEHEDKDRLKYQEALDKLVSKFRAQQAKLEAKLNAKRASESSTDLDPDVKWEGLPFGDEVKQRVHEMMRKVWTRRLADAYLKATGKELKSPEKHLDPQVGYMIGHGANVDPKILKKLKPEDSYQMQGTWSSADNVTPLMIDDAVKVLQNNPRWNTLEHVGGKVRGMRGPVPSVTWSKAND